jgi:prepilin peptidase CpaA
VTGLAFAEYVALATGIVACVTDLRRRRIPNVLTFTSALGAIGWHTFLSGFRGTGFACAGWIVGLGLLLPLYLLRSLGAGDVKLLAAFGAWLGPVDALWAGLYGTIAGGILALVVAAARGYLGTAYRNLFSLLMFWRVSGVRPMDQLTLETSDGPRLARAVPMLLGVVVTLWHKH